jgi:hypothetical protein
MNFNGFKTVFTADTYRTDRTCDAGGQCYIAPTDGTDSGIREGAALLHVHHSLK